MDVLNPTLFFQVAAASDTLLARVVGAELTALQKVLAVAQIGLVVLAYVMVGALVFAALKVAKSIDAAKDKLEDVRSDVHQLIGKADAIVTKADSMVESVKSTVDGVTDTVKRANRRAHAAASDLADRVDEFNRTLSLVQTETQDGVIAALSAIKGVTAGVSALRRGRGKGKAVREDSRGDERKDRPTRPRLKRREHAGY